MVKARQLGAFLLIGLIWGSEWIVQQAIDAPPLRALAIRYAIAAVILSCVIALRPAPFPDRRTLLAAAAVGITLLALPPFLTVWASRRISPGLLIVIFSLTPLLAALFEGRSSRWLGPLVGGVGGTALLVSSVLSLNVTHWAAMLATLAAAALIAGSYVFVKHRFSAMNPLANAAIQLAVGFATLICASLMIEGRPDGLWTRQTLISEAILAVLGSAVAFPLDYYLLKRFETFQVISIQWVVTSISVVESLAFMRQRPSSEILAGVAVAATSFWYLLTRRSGNEEPLTIRMTRPPFEG